MPSDREVERRVTRLILAAILALCFLLPATAGAATVGTATVFAGSATNDAGWAQAYAFTAAESGRVDRLNVYLDGSSTASAIELGLYGAADHGATSLLGGCVVDTPQTDAWGSCSMDAVTLTADETYWLAMLHPAGSGGKLEYREAIVEGAPQTYISRSSGLTSLPATWSNGVRYAGYRASMYADEAPPPPTASREGFPTPKTTGVPADWTPSHVVTSDMKVTQDGAVLDGYEFDNAYLIVTGQNVTVRNSVFKGGGIDNQPGSEPCGNGLLVDTVTFTPPPGLTDPVDQDSAIKWGGYIARNVKLWRRGEGLFVSGKSYGCGPVYIENSYGKLVVPANHCGAGTDDWHTDGIQGYHGDTVYITNVTMDNSEANCGTAPFFYPRNQGNTAAYIDGMLLAGGGFSFRDGMPGYAKNIKVIDGTWEYLPLNAACPVISPFDMQVVTVDADYRITSVVRDVACDMDDGA
jgi:hypothetical protein